MDDVRTSRPVMPSSVERYNAGEPSSENGSRHKKPLPPLPAASAVPDTPEVEEDDSRHQLDERA